jgi:hypothetical protein
MAFIPDAHTLLMVVQGVLVLMPAAIETCCAGACQRWLVIHFLNIPHLPDHRLCQLYPSLLSLQFCLIPITFTPAKVPLKEPIGVRAIETINTSFIINYLF